MTDNQKTYIVLYKDGARLASVYNTPDNLAYLKSQFYLSLIQRDITGTEHYTVMALKPRRQRRK